ncbi:MULTISPECIES: NAD-dependent epimerase/dehydratase family protein [unclassified Flavobacterium]|uniref:NAD-dependent epimerase/dehydratase family protein n=1 Tax=unclassified Flavobacterium TaxID=196869 RepID=UPI0025B8D2C3|nr:MULTISPECIES: NAD(P)-dependent oxidoreductase [unclassified Flavobacterium]
MNLAVVVGANGFLGSAIVNELVNMKIKVLAVYNTRFENVNKRAKLITSDELLISDFQPDCIFYVSGNYTNSHKELLSINNTLYNYSLRFTDSKFVYVSSTNVYGAHNETISENTPFNNPNNYALSKLSGEFIVSASKSYSIVRLTYVYGPGINNYSFIPQIIKSAKETNQINLFGNGGRMQDYIYIDDAVSFCINAAQTKNNWILLGATGKSISNKEVAEEIVKTIDCQIVYKDGDLGQSFKFNPEKSHSLLNWSPKVSFEDGIKMMIA